MSDMPYGCKGCNCWPDETPAYGTDDETWYPNASCPHHGLLADYTERKDTGVYRVVPALPPAPQQDEGEPVCCPSPRPQSSGTTEQKERGVLATVRRWISRASWRNPGW